MIIAKPQHMHHGKGLAVLKSGHSSISPSQFTFARTSPVLPPATTALSSLPQKLYKRRLFKPPWQHNLDGSPASKRYMIKRSSSLTASACKLTRRQANLAWRAFGPVLWPEVRQRLSLLFRFICSLLNVGTIPEIEKAARILRTFTCTLHCAAALSGAPF